MPRAVAEWIGKTPDNQITSRAFAIASGLSHYFTGLPCKRGHIDRRDVTWKKCISCVREKASEKYARDPEKARAIKYAWRKKNAEIVKASDQAFYAKNRLKIIAQKKLYYVENQKEIGARRSERYQRGREEYCAKQTAYRKANAEVVAASFKRWKAANPDVLARLSRDRRARKRNAEGSHTVEEVNTIRVSQKNKCAYCQKKLTSKAHLDHIIPLAKGGTNYARNLQWLCAPCNLSKHTRDAIDFAQSQGFLL